MSNKSGSLEKMCHMLEHLNSKLLSYSFQVKVNFGETDNELILGLTMLNNMSIGDNFLNNCFNANIFLNNSNIRTSPIVMANQNKLSFVLVKYVYPILLLFGITGNFWSFLGLNFFHFPFIICLIQL
jgi:hypothetical protein